MLRYCRITLALQFLALNSFLLCMHGAAYEVHTFPLVTYYVLGAEYVCVCVCKSLCVYGFRMHLSKKNDYRKAGLTQGFALERLPEACTFGGAI